MIKTFRAVGYGCLKDVSVALPPMCALIGPNDSGKSSLLRGIRTVVQFASGTFQQKGDEWEPFDPGPFLLPASPDGIISESERALLGCGVDGGWYAVAAMGKQFEERVSEPGQGDETGIGPYRKETRAWLHLESRIVDRNPHTAAIVRQLRGARLFRFDPDSLRRPSGLIPHTSVVGFLDDRGDGLPGVYQAILGRGDDAFGRIRDSVRRLFPTVKRVGVNAITTDRLVLEAELHDGTVVRASEMSEGLLYYLAFAAIPYLDRAAVLLVEEPENGLHPARVAEVIRLLRDIVHETGTQVVMATHSPLVVNELAPEEVVVVTRPSLDAGTKVTPIKQTKNFEKRSKIYALGELWLSYANGEDEAGLLTEPAA